MNRRQRRERARRRMLREERRGRRSSAVQGERLMSESMIHPPPCDPATEEEFFDVFTGQLMCRPRR
jgi:hypothetical protein